MHSEKLNLKIMYFKVKMHEDYKKNIQKSSIGKKSVKLIKANGFKIM